MITLNSEYQYIGRTNAVKAYGYNFKFYVLLYAKTKPNPVSGKHTVGVKMRLVSTADSTFYKYYTNGAAAIDGVSAIAWNKQTKPAAAWPAGSLTEDGVKYPRWTDLAEGTAEVDVAFCQKEVTITASWQRRSISGTVPAWLPSTTKATASLQVLLPAIEKEDPFGPGLDPEPEPDPEPVPDGVRIYADGELVCDSRLEDHDLVGLEVTRGLNVGGTADITMEFGHPAYDKFISQKTIVEIVRNGKLRFRGRALYPEETFYRTRTVTCEGELCFFRDSVNRPYSYNDTPENCLTILINQHNAQVDSQKRFKVGVVTVAGLVELANESAELTQATLKKLIDQHGGFIVFTTSSDGSRVINWLATINRRSNQTIEFGENLLSLSSTGSNNPDFATGLVPYGAKDDETKKRLTIESVNGGKDYILAEDAVSVRGIIMATKTWDHITDAETLLATASEELNSRKAFVTSLKLTALDLSYLDRSLDSFDVGDVVPVLSAPHGLNDDFQVSQMTENLLNPKDGTITLGRDVPSLTGSGVDSDKQNQNELESVKVKYDAVFQQVASWTDVSALLARVIELEKRLGVSEE